MGHTIPFSCISDTYLLEWRAGPRAEGKLLDALVLPRKRLLAVARVHERFQPPPEEHRLGVEDWVEASGEDAVVLVKGRLVVRNVLRKGQREAQRLQRALPLWQHLGRRVRPPVEFLGK